RSRSTFPCPAGRGIMRPTDGEHEALLVLPHRVLGHRGPRGRDLGSSMQFLSARDQGWWLTGALLGVSLALAAWVNLALPGSYLAPSLYAIPMLVAARRASVRRAVLIAVATQALY